MPYLRNLGRAFRTLGRAATGRPMAGSTGYEGASTGRRLAMWAEVSTAISALLAAEGDTMRARCRGLVRKNAWAKSAQDSYVANAIGCGITPKPLHPDPVMRTLLKTSWERSAQECDADGLTDFYGQQVIALREIFEAGEVLARFRPRLASDGLRVPLQLQLLEPEHLPLTRMGTNGKNPIRAGIEFTPFGKRAAYWLHPEHPMLGGMTLQLTSNEPVRVPAEQVIHCYQPLRCGQVRGQPWLAPVMVTLYELDKFSDAVLVRQATANFFLGWQRSLSDEFRGPLDAGTTLPDGTAAPDASVGFGTIQPNTIIDLGATGNTLEFNKPPDPPAGLPEFIKTMLRSFCAGIGIPYESVSWDLEGVNYSSIRAGLLEYRRRIEQFQFSVMVYQFCRPVYRRWVNDAVLAGVLPQPRTPAEWDALYAVEWRTPRWGWVDPLKDVMAMKEAVRCAFTSRSAVIHENGEDPEQVDADIAADNARAKDLGIVSDSDPAQTANSGAAQQLAVQGAP
jgi:lambda family phage portal protein